ncbi:MAG TPA: Uma2 family endonuclease [Actinoplanes sp.]|nr:Uma2 family endonuclease [Actinoplanes sp.]
MSAQAFGAKMPTHLTLNDVANMAAADENHRYELSPEGVLSVMPPADPEHALLVTRMIFWLASHGYEAEQVAADCGIDVGGGRVPDLTVWAKGMPPRRAQSSYAGTAGLLLAVEVVSSGSETVDRITKKAEYAKAGIPRYWIVEREGAATVHRHVLNEAGQYEPDPAGPQPFAWLLSSTPEI